MTARDLGLFLVRHLPGLDAIARRLYRALPSVLHDTPTSRLRRLFGPGRSLTFVQIGAFDGVAGDPIRPLILENAGWSGVLVEPQPAAFAALVRNYGPQAARLDFVNAAVAPQAGETTLYAVPEDEIRRLDLPGWLRETASFTRKHVARHAGDCRIEEMRIAAMPFADVASRLPDGRVDLVVIDVEGHERIILDDIDFDRHGISVLVFEHKHLSSEDAGAVASRLARHGFSTKTFGRDTIAWRRLEQGSRAHAPVRPSAPAGEPR